MTPSPSSKAVSAGTKAIPLSQGMFAIVDSLDYPWLNQWKWHAKARRKEFYACRFEQKNKVIKTIKMHNAIMNPPEGLFVDHINRKPLDNRRANLRICTYSENNMNRPSFSGFSKYKCVCWDKVSSRWYVRMRYNGKSRFFGYYEDEIDAAIASNVCMQILRGEFSVLNNV